MFELVEAWYESGQTQDFFCKEKQMPKPTFCYWVKMYREEKSQLNTSENSTPFIPLTITSDFPNLEMLDHIEIEYPNGTRITCPASISPIQLQILLSQ